MEEIVLAVVLTSGNIRRPVVGSNNGEIRLIPGRACQKRLEKAAKFLRSDRSARLAIVGGYRDDIARREAVVAERWFIQFCPDLADRIIIVDARANCTAEDMKLLPERMATVSDKYLFLGVVIVSHPDHGGLAGIPLRLKLWQSFRYPIPIRCEASGEPPPYGRVGLALRRFVYKHDPLWERFLSYPLRQHANRRSCV
ncbi:MAG: hypothetical protein NUV80_05820 [Candidatus Berkelbacteria bacterium]|nr:hypothetical protein [Candidatus Berkelbacteria bacterium]